jgi:hypothetical protein
MNAHRIKQTEKEFNQFQKHVLQYMNYQLFARDVVAFKKGKAIPVTGRGRP